MTGNSLTCCVRVKDEQTDVEQRRQQVKINQLKGELEVTLKRPLLPAGFSPAYPTFGGHQISLGMPGQLVEGLSLKNYSYIYFLSSICKSMETCNISELIINTLL